MKTISVNTEQQKEELMRKVMKTSSLVHTVVCTANDIAHTQMLDAIEHLKDAGMFRRGVKRYAMEALRHYGRYEKIRKSDTGDREALHVDYLDFAQESLEADVRNLYFSAKMFLDRRKEDNTAVKADVIAAEALLFSAIRIFDSVMAHARERHGHDFTGYFGEPTVLIKSQYTRGRRTAGKGDYLCKFASGMWQVFGAEAYMNKTKE